MEGDTTFAPMDETTDDVEVLSLPAGAAKAKAGAAKGGSSFKDNVIVLDEAEGARGGPKGLDFGKDPVGCRVRVEVAGGEFCEGTVGKWDKKEKGYKIEFDDGEFFSAKHQMPTI